MAEAQLQATLFQSGFSSPLYIGSPPGDLNRLFVCEQSTGKTKIIKNGATLPNAFITFGVLYYLVPALWGRQRLYSLRLVSLHFWIATIGILLYITAMWVSGIMQGLMWRAYDQLGFLQYSFVETVQAMHPFYLIRALGGLLFLIGALVMAYNLWRTARGDVARAAA